MCKWQLCLSVPVIPQPLGSFCFTGAPKFDTADRLRIGASS